VYRRGIVTRTDPTTGRVKVRFPDRDNVESWWLEVGTPKTHQDKAYWMPDVGEHVACLMDDHAEAGVVAAAIYSQADRPPVDSQDKWHILTRDGTVIEHDRAEHRLLVDMSAPGGRCTITSAPATFDLSPEAISLTVGGVSVTACRPSDGAAEAISLTVGGVSVTISESGVAIVGDVSITGDVNVNGSIHATGTIIDDSGNTNHHSH